MTWGYMRPVILLPRESVNWSKGRFEAVMLHELAHVRRGDSISQLLVLAVCALYWFNPVVWLCARALRSEAEMAADDTVLGLGIFYLNHLLLMTVLRVDGEGGAFHWFVTGLLATWVLGAWGFQRLVRRPGWERRRRGGWAPAHSLRPGRSRRGTRALRGG